MFLSKPALLALLAATIPNAHSVTWGGANDSSVTLTFRTSMSAKADRFFYVPSRDTCTALKTLVRTDKQVGRYGDMGSTVEVGGSVPRALVIASTSY